MFYSFRQNNSGGSFVVDSDVDIHVIVEAPDESSALTAFECHRGYFDGVDKGLDCECCGDRWSTYCEELGKLNVETAADSREDFAVKTPSMRFMSDCVVYLADGRRKFGNFRLLAELDEVLDEMMEDV